MPVSLRPLLAHVVAAILAIAFAARIVASPYVATGLMFVAPGIVLLAAHAAFDFAMSRGRLSSRRVLARAATTAGACIAVVFAAMVILPLPGAAANVSNVIDGIGVFLFCVLALAPQLGRAQTADGALAGLASTGFEPVRLASGCLPSGLSRYGS